MLLKKTQDMDSKTVKALQDLLTQELSTQNEDQYSTETKLPEAKTDLSILKASKSTFQQ